MNHEATFRFDTCFCENCGQEFVSLFSDADGFNFIRYLFNQLSTHSTAKYNMPSNVSFYGYLSLSEYSALFDLNILSSEIPTRDRSRYMIVQKGTNFYKYTYSFPSWRIGQEAYEPCCPICQSKCIQRFTNDSEDRCLYNYNRIHDIASQWFDKNDLPNANHKMQHFVNEVNAVVLPTKKDKPLNTKYILEYLKCLVENYTNILSLQKLLKNYYYRQAAIARACLRCEKKITLGYWTPQMPADLDIPMPQMPEEPTLSKARFFNKKKVQSANEQAMHDYEIAMADFEKKLKEFESILAKRKEFESSSALAVQNIKGGHPKETDLTFFPFYSGVWKKNNLYNVEIRKCQASLKNLYETQAQLYSLNIIYPKYLTLPACSTIYEYLKSGRCDTLAGPNGAYNLYESESRQDIIIAKLDDVLVNLEEIKYNQQMIYSALVEMQNSVANMTSKMTSMVSSLSSIQESSSASAYYNYQTSYYSKIAMQMEATQTFIEIWDRL